MDNETKRDVFNQVAGELNDLMGTIDSGGYYHRYETALPDDLPVIPEAVGDVIVKLKHKRFSLSGAMSYAALVSLSPWMTSENEDTFARAWLDGVWRVDGTGEIVKLEAEK